MIEQRKEKGNKGFLSPFSFIVFYVVVFSIVVSLMAGTGFTGVSSNVTFDPNSPNGMYDVDCQDAINCGLSFYDNMVLLLTFNSTYAIFNWLLGIMYLLLIVAVVSLILGG